MNTSITHPEVAAFVAAVRRALDDLTPDEIDDLTGGLEADLDDALTDGGAASGIERFGSPADYAAELRSAAGLPPRAAAGGRRAAGLVDLLGAQRAIVLARLERQAWWPPVRDFLLVLRPAWWLMRAGLFSTVFFGVGYGGLSWGLIMLFGVLLVLSVQAGRRGWARRNIWLRVGFVAINAVAILLVPGGLRLLPTSTTIYDTVPEPPRNGLWLNGTEVRNVLVYDAQGRPLTDVQLFDENGKPLSVGESARTPLWQGDTSMVYSGQPPVAGTTQIPAVTDQGRVVWNVFPLRQQKLEFRGETDSNGMPMGAPAGPPAVAPAPQGLVPRVVGIDGSTYPAATPDPVATPTPAPSSVGRPSEPGPVASPGRAPLPTVSPSP
ncbi:MAG: hypothetical protein U0Q19_00935 [Kineosporiaceae bacterium]